MPLQLPQTRQILNSVTTIIIITAIIGLTVSDLSVVAQDAQPELLAPPSEITNEMIDEAVKQIEVPELDEQVKTQLLELYERARAELISSTKTRESAAQFKAWIKNAGIEIEEAKRLKGLPLQAINSTTYEMMDLKELLKEQTTLEQQLSEGKSQLQKVQGEPQRRVNRKASLPTLLGEAQAALLDIQKQLAAVPADDVIPAVFKARRFLLGARRQTQEALVASLENERNAYEAQGELPRLQIDLATARVNHFEQELRQLVSTITKRRKMDAASQREDAELAWENAPILLKPIAQQNIDLAKRRIELASEIQIVSARRHQISQQLGRWQEDYARTQKWADATNSDTLGMMLIDKRNALPSRAQTQQRITNRETKLRSIQQEWFELEDRRTDLSNFEVVMRTSREEILSQMTDGLPEDRRISDATEQALKDSHQLEVRILDNLITEVDRNYSLHLEADKDQRELLSVVQKYRSFIDRRVFWVRSTSPLGSADVANAIEAFVWLTNISSWQSAAGVVRRNIVQYPVRSLLYCLSIIFLLIYRRRIRHQLEDLGQVAAPISCHTIKPTMQAFLLTILLASPWVLLVHCISLALSGASDELVRAISSAISGVTIGLFTLELGRQICRPQGLAESHFGWSSHSLVVIKSTLRLFIFTGVPLAFMSLVFEYQRNITYQTSLGRICLILFLMLFTGAFYRLFRYQDGVLNEMLERTPSAWLKRLHVIWSRLIILLPLILAVLAISGSQHTAFQLTDDLWRTIELSFVLWLLGALLFRWLRVKRRRIRWQQLVEARQRAADDTHPQTSDLDAQVVKEDEVDLFAIDHQSRRLISGFLFGAFLLGLSPIWYEVFPALSPILEQQLWEVQGVGGVTKSVSLGAVLFATLVVGIALLASRNIPGLIDVMLLGRLGFESSTRYAISRLSQYTIVITGTLFACSALGITWSKAQWLIAALSVGLGFGLQEIVANFVCGILLLFERPIRVGDTVTLGETTGVVVRIRSRATTVRNWDRQEVVIPNKELITARIINWTLTDQLNRIVVQVGIAYGSDTDNATELLLQIAKDNANILDEPGSLVTFDQFGDSTLNFTMRAYLANMDARLETVHQLHTTINERFAKEAIEIAFPQTDLHIRSIDPSVPIPNNPGIDTRYKQ